MKVSWTWRGKKYSGTLIPSKEDKNNRYARTENGKIKTLPKKKSDNKSKKTHKMPNGDIHTGERHTKDSKLVKKAPKKKPMKKPMKKNSNY